MLFSAIVLDNTDFYSKGTITVRIARSYNAPWTWDLSDNDSILNEFQSLKNSGKVEDYDNCLVGSPMGSGRNYGMFWLPQINSIGIVTFLDNTFDRPCWMGGFFRPIRSENPDENKRVDFVNIPNDDETQEGKGTDGSGGELGGKQSTAEDAAIVIRTKSTTSDEYNWEERNTENLIVIDANKINIVHFLEWENNVAKKYQKIQIENGEVKVEVNNQTDGKISSYSMTEDAMTIEIDDGGTKSTLTISNEDNGISATLDGEKKIKLLGEDNFLTKFNELSEILTYVAEHKHVCPINGLTVEDPVSGDGKPFSAAIASTKNAMKTERIVTE